MKLFLALIIICAGGILMAEEQILVEMKTTEGDITIELYPDNAPVTVANFLKYVEDEFYDGVVFHRVIDGFMVQTGGFTAEHKSKVPTYSQIKNEADNGLQNTVGTLAMARTNAPHSASSQFFINVKDNHFLNYQNERNYGYCVFGKVISGMEVITKIKSVKTHVQPSLGMKDWPVEDIVILSIRRI